MLLNIAYISEFMTNLVSQSIFASKRVYFDGKTKFIWDNITIRLVEPVNKRYILEQSKKNNTSSTFLLSSAVKTINNWHHVLGHALHKAIKHLQTSAQGVEVSDANFWVLKTSECEMCAFFKLQQIISCSLDKSKTSNKPFHQTTYDLMQFKALLNNHQWVLHFACFYTNFNLVFTHAQKLEATSVIKEAFAIIKNCFNGKVVFFDWTEKKH